MVDEDRWWQQLYRYDDKEDYGGCGGGEAGGSGGSGADGRKKLLPVLDKVTDSHKLKRKNNRILAWTTDCSMKNLVKEEIVDHSFLFYIHPIFRYTKTKHKKIHWSTISS